MVDQEQSIPPEWQRWRGHVDTKLDVLKVKVGDIDRKVDGHTDKLNALPTEIEERMIKALNGRSKQSVTFKWLVEKLAVPVLLSIAGIAIGLLLRGGI